MLGHAAETVWDRRARIEQVTDGDTVVAVLDQGFGDTKKLTLRLLATWAPEGRQPGGPETAAFVRQWNGAARALGGEWPVVVETVRVRADTHEVTTLGRYVAVVHRADGRCLNDDVNAFVAAHGYGGGIGS